MILELWSLPSSFKYVQLIFVLTHKLNDILFSFLLFSCIFIIIIIFFWFNVVKIPLKSVGVDETTVVTFLELLNLRSSITKLDHTYVTSPCIRRMAEEGSILPLESNWGNATIREKQIKDLDAVFVGATSSPINNAVTQSIVHDSDILGRAEWIKYFATFFNLEHMAKDHFAQVVSRYECHKDKAILKTFFFFTCLFLCCINMDHKEITPKGFYISIPLSHTIYFILFF